MIKEFEGKTEKEAIDKAIKELSLDQEEFDVEIVEAPKKGGLFRRGSVRIRVHVNEEEAVDAAPEPRRPRAQAQQRRAPRERSEPTPHAAANPLEPVGEIEPKVIAFLEELLEKMDLPGSVKVLNRDERKIVLGIESVHNNLLIGKKGKNLDAIQVLANVFAAKIGKSGTRIIVDAEQYRSRREDSLVRLATQMAEQVRRNRGSKLLEPMNPFERRLIHTTLNGYDDIDTKSEGEGLYKQVRVIYRGPNQRRQQI